MKMNRSKTPATPLSLEFLAWTCVIQPIFSDFSQNIFLVSFAAVIKVVTQRFSQKRCVTTLIKTTGNNLGNNAHEKPYHCFADILVQKIACRLLREHVKVAPTQS